MLKKNYLLCVALLIVFSARSQEKHAHENEVNNLVLQDSLIKNTKNVILFTGSSSIRMWTDLQTDFPDKNVLNRAFGGSTMHDLLYFADQVIIPYNPKTIFIYEGDNDLGFANTAPQQILASGDSLLSIIRAKLPNTIKIYFISPKPSIVRWHLKDQYVEFNRQLKAWAKAKKNVYFIDVWTPMIHADGSLKTELFMEDGLHMNRKGYDIWREVLQAYVE